MLTPRKPIILGLAAVLALVLAACDYSHTATTLKIIKKQELIGGDEPFVSVLEYRSTVGVAGSTQVTWKGGTDQYAQNSPEGTVLNIPAAHGRSEFRNIDYSECERIANGRMPTVVGQAIVTFENDFSSQQPRFMADMRTKLETRLRNNIENLQISDPSNCRGAAVQIADRLVGVSGIEADVASSWPNYDQGFFTDDDDLIGTGFTAFVNTTDHLEPLTQYVNTEFPARLNKPNQASGNIFNPTYSKGRTATLRVSGDGAVYDINLVTDNLWDQTTPPFGN